MRREGFPSALRAKATRRYRISRHPEYRARPHTAFYGWRGTFNSSWARVSICASIHFDTRRRSSYVVRMDGIVSTLAEDDSSNGAP